MPEKGKTQFDYLNCNVPAVLKEIQDFLVAYQFKQLPEYGPNVYQNNDPWKGIKGFEYYFEGTHLVIFAYANKPTNPIRIDTKGIAYSAVKNDYMDMMRKLSIGINQLSTGGVRMDSNNNNMNNDYYQNGAQDNNGYYQNGAQDNNGYYQNGAPDSNGYYQNQPQDGTYYQNGNNGYGNVQPQQGQYNPNSQNGYNKYADEQDKKNTIMAIASLIISIVMLLLSCVGVTFGAIIVAGNFFLIAQGMKSSKKGLAIAAMVINIVAICIGIGWLIFSVVGNF